MLNDKRGKFPTKLFTSPTLLLLLLSLFAFVLESTSSPVRNANERSLLDLASNYRNQQQQLQQQRDDDDNDAYNINNNNNRPDNRLVLTPKALNNLVRMHQQQQQQQQQQRPRFNKRAEPPAGVQIPEVDLTDLLGLDGKIPLTNLDIGEEDTVINAPIPFSKTSPEWKLAVISFLLNMKAKGLNIDLVDTGVRKKVGAAPNTVIIKAVLFIITVLLREKMAFLYSFNVFNVQRFSEVLPNFREYSVRRLYRRARDRPFSPL